MSVWCYLKIYGWRWLYINLAFPSFHDMGNILLCRVLINRGKLALAKWSASRFTKSEDLCMLQFNLKFNMIKMT